MGIRGDHIKFSLDHRLRTENYLPRKMLEAIPEDPTPLMRLKKADLQCLLAKPEERADAVREYLEAVVAVLAENPWRGDQLQCPDRKNH